MSLESLRFVDVRFLATAQAPLEQAVAAGRFRADLRARLEGQVIGIPSLRAAAQRVQKGPRWHASCLACSLEVPAMTPPETASTATAANFAAHGAPASAGSFDLVQEIAQLRNSAQYLTTGHAAHTLVKRPELRVVLIVLRRDAELKEHSTNQPVSLQTLMGQVRVTLPGGSPEQGVGGLMVIEPSLAHEVKAIADSAILVSMPWSEHAQQ